ncbi:collagen-like protein [Microvirga brassicacearum]|uniref:Collagen-like protein n=1 Tax=Microvirga brassicacearum TaxID=2580413 RepID=A0A5N3PH83_9HYPH|nr:collagen-like protein [Microvirga brassicacearum]KAB0269078.1 collagen-like protein [Microvirga brassicacearum]
MSDIRSVTSLIDAANAAPALVAQLAEATQTALGQIERASALQAEISELLQAINIETRWVEDKLEVLGPEGWLSSPALTGPVGPVGPIGNRGFRGDPGPRGDPVQLRVNTGLVQYKYEAEPNDAWRNIFTLSDLQGDPGPQGIQGVPGPTGEVGPQGPVGPAGPAGADGTSPAVASDAEAKAGTENTKIMSALRVRAAIDDRKYLPTGGGGTPRTLSDWLASAPINTFTASHALDPADKSAYLHVNSASSVTITLPNNWLPGEGCAVRRLGAGAVVWALAAGATKQVPASKSAHVGIAEQYGEVFFRVVSNAGGTSAVWAIEGATA